MLQQKCSRRPQLYPRGRVAAEVGMTVSVHQQGCVSVSLFLVHRENSRQLILNACVFHFYKAWKIRNTFNRRSNIWNVGACRIDPTRCSDPACVFLVALKAFSLTYALRFEFASFVLGKVERAKLSSCSSCPLNDSTVSPRAFSRIPVCAKLHTAA